MPYRPVSRIRRLPEKRRGPRPLVPGLRPGNKWVETSYDDFKTMNELFKQAIDKACKERKFLPIGYLTATYSKDELAELLETAMQINANLKNAQALKMEKELTGYTAFYVFQIVAFLDNQIVMIRRAKKHLDGIHEQQFGTIEGKIIDFDLTQN